MERGSGPNTILAFDFGLRQIGVAVGNTAIESSQPLRVVRARDGIPDWQVIHQLADEWQPDLILVGSPLNMDGTQSALGQRAEKFARRLHGRLGLPVEMSDERLTSFEAKLDSRERGHRGDYKAQPVDSLAAELILQSWFRQRAAP